ncbi:internal virion protein [Klebsiella phage IME264]|nr:internal virion protein [Klebsiella phage IME264]
MCWMAAIPIAMTAVQAIGQSRNEAKMIGLQNDQMRRQSAQMIKESNIQNANASLEQKQKLEEASADLTAKNLDKVQAMGTIRAAIGEGNLEGASMERISRIERASSFGRPTRSPITTAETMRHCSLSSWVTLSRLSTKLSPCRKLRARVSLSWSRYSTHWR